MNALNKVEVKTAAVYQEDYDQADFRFIKTNKGDVLAFERRGGTQRILAVFNFGGCDYPEVVLSMPEPAELTEIFSSSGESGNDPVLLSDERAVSVRYPQPGREYRLTLNLNALSGILYTVKEMPVKETAAETVRTTAKKTAEAADIEADVEEE